VLKIVRGTHLVPRIFSFYLGPRRELFLGQALLLLNNSSYCRDLFAENPQTTRFEAADITLATFQQLYHWISFDDPRQIAQDVAFRGLTRSAFAVQEMLKVCIAAWKLKCNAIEDLLIGLLGIGYFRSGLSPSAEDIDLVFKETLGFDPVSRLCHYMSVSFNIRMMDWQNQPPEFLDVLTVARKHSKIQTDFFYMIGEAALKDGRIQKPRELMDYTICDFHTHSAGTGCWAAQHTFASHPFLG
jgi:hypothetical protein